MKKNSSKDEHSMGMNDIHGLDKKENPHEYDDILELSRMLADRDFSKTSNKERVYYQTLKNIKQYQEGHMRNSNKSSFNKVASIALVCLLGFSITQTSFGHNMIDKVLRTISLGHITISEEAPIEREPMPVPEELKGRIFDQDGNEIHEFTMEHTQIFTADGEEIAHINRETGEIITVEERKKQKESDTLVVKDPDQLSNYTRFKVILPDYLPRGYRFDRAGLFKDESGVVPENSKYIELFFTNDETGEYMYMQQRFADEETAYSTGSDQVEALKINGVDAVFYGGKNIDWEYNGVIYMLSGRGVVSREELIKIAESIK
ncbi:DUF4367 domain-containing protein [Clostridiaceae bacterium 35-E11]